MPYHLFVVVGVWQPAVAYSLSGTFASAFQVTSILLFWNMAILNCSLSPIACNIAGTCTLDFDCVCHVILIRKGQP